MIGPGQRHNTKPFLDFFQQNDTPFSLTFVSTGPFHFDKQNYPDIEVKEVRKTNPFTFIYFFFLLRVKYDLIWYHGAYHWPLALMIYLSKNRKSKLNLNIWSEKFPRIAIKGTIIGKLYRWFFKKADFVQCNWYGTEELVRKAQPKASTNVHLWGLHYKYYEELKPEDDYKVETLNFVTGLPENKTKFFFPKSLTPTNRHDLVIKACENLIKKGIHNFIIYFWLGRSDPRLLKMIKQKINKTNTSNYIKIIKMPFLPFKDMKYIWSKIDCGMSIVDQDQLSTTVVEPLFMKREMVISDIRPYQLLNEKYDLKLELTNNNAGNIAKKMKKLINGKRTSQKQLDNRRKIIETEFNFRDNLEKMVKYYHNKIQQS